jgi:hypothetical protein
VAVVYYSPQDPRGSKFGERLVSAVTSAYDTALAALLVGEKASQRVLFEFAGTGKAGLANFAVDIVKDAAREGFLFSVAGNAPKFIASAVLGETAAVVVAAVAAALSVPSLPALAIGAVVGGIASFIVGETAGDNFKDWVFSSNDVRFELTSNGAVTFGALYSSGLDGSKIEAAKGLIAAASVNSLPVNAGDKITVSEGSSSQPSFAVLEGSAGLFGAIGVAINKSADQVAAFAARNGEGEIVQNKDVFAETIIPGLVLGDEAALLTFEVGTRGIGIISARLGEISAGSFKGDDPIRIAFGSASADLLKLDVAGYVFGGAGQDELHGSYGNDTIVGDFVSTSIKSEGEPAGFAPLVAELARWEPVTGGSGAADRLTTRHVALIAPAPHSPISLHAIAMG